jgi:hypothetical protein
MKKRSRKKKTICQERGLTRKLGRRSVYPENLISLPCSYLSIIQICSIHVVKKPWKKQKPTMKEHITNLGSQDLHNLNLTKKELLTRQLQNMQGNKGEETMKTQIFLFKACVEKKEREQSHQVTSPSVSFSHSFIHSYTFINTSTHAQDLPLCNCNRWLRSQQKLLSSASDAGA